MCVGCVCVGVCALCGCGCVFTCVCVHVCVRTYVHTCVIHFFFIVISCCLFISEKIMEKQYNYPPELSVSKHAKDLISRFLVDG